jgi:hypothetical protein
MLLFKAAKACCVGLHHPRCQMQQEHQRAMWDRRLRPIEANSDKHTITNAAFGKHKIQTCIQNTKHKKHKNTKTLKQK